MANTILPKSLFITLLILAACSGKINEKKSTKDGASIQMVQGGILVYDVEGHGLIVSPTDLGKYDWTNAMTACDQLSLNGYNDWRLPTRMELDTLYSILKLRDKGDFEDNSYWSSSEYNSYYAYRKNFKTGKIDRRGNKTKKQLVRPVRSY